MLQIQRAFNKAFSIPPISSLGRILSDSIYSTKIKVEQILNYKTKYY